MPNLIFWEKPRSSFRRLLNRKTLRSSLRQSPACFAMGPPEAPQAASSIELRNCYVARFQLPPEAPQAVSIGLRNCYVARFEYPFKTSKASKVLQQLSKAFEPQNSPQQLATAPRFLCHGTSRGPTSCFYRASKLLRGTFCAPPQEPQKPRSSFRRRPEAPQAVSIGLRNCYVARFEDPFKTSKALQQFSKARCRKTDVHLPSATMLARRALRVPALRCQRGFPNGNRCLWDDPIRVGHPLPFRSVLCSSDKSKEAVWRIIVTLLVENKCEFKHQFWVKIIITCELLWFTQLFI